MTIADLKVGSKLVFGSYGVGETLNPITWIKANRDGEFLSEFVLDMLKFDEEERNNPNYNKRYCGNGDYELSNILQFLNSYEEDWYEPTHLYDASPGSYDRPYDRNGDYLLHAGFLNAFEDYEIESLSGRINLPTDANIYGVNGEPKFTLFNRKGFRGKPTFDLVHRRHGHGLDDHSFCEYWIVGYGSEAYQQMVVGRDGGRRNAYADSRMGIRPKCTIKPELEVEMLSDGSYRIVPFEASIRRGPQVATDDELLNLMGLL